MRLAAFITANIEEIAAAWERFAATLLPEQEFASSILRDGIVEILGEIAADMDRAQSGDQQREKSEGTGTPGEPIEAAAAKHALARVRMGLSTRQLIAEFRALRATVIRLWEGGIDVYDTPSLYDLTRFNEAVDQLLMDATIRYSEEVDRARDVFLGVLGHDLRTPLTAITGLAQLQMRVSTPERTARFASQIVASAARMSHMITDLVALTRVRLGAGIAIDRARVPIRELCAACIREMEAIYPGRVFTLTCDEGLSGEWDGARMAQVVTNLLGNAIQHGATDAPVTLTARGDGGSIELAFHNEGPAIPPDTIPKLFDLLFHDEQSQTTEHDYANSLGLGLYICKEIVLAHDGTIEVHSSGSDGTTFIVRV